MLPTLSQWSRVCIGAVVIPGELEGKAAAGHGEIGYREVIVAKGGVIGSAIEQEQSLLRGP